MHLLIAIDDTDNLQSRGTGYCARQLAAGLETEGLARVSGITRHQLYVHEEIPYTSHNSSACLNAEGADTGAITAFCKRFLINNSAQGSDAGLCIAPWELVDERVAGWGRDAKRIVLTMDAAKELARSAQLYLEGFTGTHGGIIGALAAVGLHKAGNDGRFLQVRGMRKKMGVWSAREILEVTGVENIHCHEGREPSLESKILLEEWWRPVLKNHKATLVVEQVNNNPYHEYRIIPKNFLKKLSS